MFIKKHFGLIIVVILFFWAIKPLFIPGFFPMHDDTQVARVFEMGNSLKDGMFPVRWVSSLGYGYGYPIFNFYAPLVYYVGGYLTLIGFDALVATKIMIGLGMMLAGIFMYFLGRFLWGDIGGMVSALFYMYASYHAVNLYVRGAVAELYAYAFIPLVFYGLIKVYTQKKWRYVVIGSLGYAGIILSHNLTAMMVTPFILAATLLYGYMAFRNKQIFIIYYLLFTVSAGLLLSAFYWLPALLEMKYTNVFSQIGGGADFADHFVCMNQLWNSAWRFGGSVPGCLMDGLSFQIGKLHIVLSILSLLALLAWRNIKKEKQIVFLYTLISLSISVLLILEQSKSIWEFVEPMKFIQYPWRFLLFISFFSSLLAGFFVWFLGAISTRSKYFNTAPYLSGGILIFFLLVLNLKLFNPQTILSKTAADYTNDTALKWTASKISDEYMPKDFRKPESSEEIAREKISVLQGNVKINSLYSKTQEMSAIIYAEEPSILRINIAYFPFWEVFIDSTKTSFETYNDGLIVSLPEGYHTLLVKINQTNVEKTANMISIIGVFILAIGIIYKRKRLTL